MFDDSDVAIIELLKENARRSNRDIAKHLAMTEAAIRKRLSRLFDRRLLRIVPWINAPEANMKAVIFAISVDLQRLESVAREVASIPEVYFCGIVTGQFDIIAHALFWSDRHLFEFLKQRLSAIQGIKSIQTSAILGVVKFDFSPSVLQSSAGGSQRSQPRVRAVQARDWDEAPDSVERGDR